MLRFVWHVWSSNWGEERKAMWILFGSLYLFVRKKFGWWDMQEIYFIDFIDKKDSSMGVEIWKRVKVCFRKDLVMDTVSILSTSSSILHISQSAIANTAGWGWCHGQLWSHGSTTCLAVETWLEIISKIAWILHLNGQTQRWISHIQIRVCRVECNLWTVWPQTLEIWGPCLAKGATKYWDLRRRPRWLLGVIQTNRKAFGFHTESALKWYKFHKGLKGVTLKWFNSFLSYFDLENGPTLEPLCNREVVWLYWVILLALSQCSYSYKANTCLVTSLFSETGGQRSETSRLPNVSMP